MFSFIYQFLTSNQLRFFVLNLLGWQLILLWFGNRLLVVFSFAITVGLLMLLVLYELFLYWQRRAEIGYVFILNFFTLLFSFLLLSLLSVYLLLFQLNSIGFIAAILIQWLQISLLSLWVCESAKRLIVE